MNAFDAIRSPAGTIARSGSPASRPEPFQRTLESELDQLKNRLLRETLERAASPAVMAPLRRAANEAASLAWLEPLPMLVFPELFQEKARVADQYARRQRSVRARSATFPDRVAGESG